MAANRFQNMQSLSGVRAVPMQVPKERQSIDLNGVKYKKIFDNVNVIVLADLERCPRKTHAINLADVAIFTPENYDAYGNNNRNGFSFGNNAPVFDGMQHFVQFNRNLQNLRCPIAQQPAIQQMPYRNQETEQNSRHEPENIIMQDSGFEERSLRGNDTEEPQMPDSTTPDYPISLGNERVQRQPNSFPRPMIPGISRRNTANEHNTENRQPPAGNVFITNTERNGCIVNRNEFNRLYQMVEQPPRNVVVRRNEQPHLYDNDFIDLTQSDEEEANRSAQPVRSAQWNVYCKRAMRF